MLTSTINKRGQTTIPQLVRQQLNLQTNQTLLWQTEEDGSLIIRPLPGILHLYGTLGTSPHEPPHTEKHPHAE